MTTPYPYGRFAYLGYGIYLGSRDRCATRPDHTRAIHIRHPNTPIECTHEKVGDLHVEYTERQPLGRQVLEDIRDYTLPPGGIFVHCAAGQCRGPTLALVCLIARGCKPWEAVALIIEAMWNAYPHQVAPHFECTVLHEILTWWSSRSS